MNEFKRFTEAHTCKETFSAYRDLCSKLGLENAPYDQFLDQLSFGLTNWKCKKLFEQLKKKIEPKESNAGKSNTSKVLIVGAGPCGLRAAIEAAFLRYEVVVIDKRNAFTRNNVLHLWPFVVTDLKNLGIKHFYSRFCCGELDHISIRRLQLCLLKIALLLGVKIYTEVEFLGLKSPITADGKKENGWRCVCKPESHEVSKYQFDVLIAATGARDALCEYDIYDRNGKICTRKGFDRKEFRGQLSIAITANFVNENNPDEIKAKEVGGIASHFHQQLFKDLKTKKKIHLENFVYYKDETHYFVMTAKKSSLLERGVFRQDFILSEDLMQKSNVDIDALLSYAKDAAQFCTNNAFLNLKFALNSRGYEDVAMLDFSSKFEAVNASRIIERNGSPLLIGLVGDSLLEPFWPQGTGCARGFLGAMDAVWMMKKWRVMKGKPFELIAERESVYKVLSQTNPNNIKKKYSDYTIDPNSRYLAINLKTVGTQKARQFYDNADIIIDRAENTDFDEVSPPKRSKQSDGIDFEDLLSWCQKALEGCRNIQVQNLTTSWRSGCELGLLMYKYRPHIINRNDLDPTNPWKTMSFVVDIAKQELGICPVLTVSEMINCSISNEVEMASYLYQFYELFHQESIQESTKSDEEMIVETTDIKRQPSAAEMYPHKEKHEEKSSEMCLICKKELFILERISVEEMFCHRSCLRCESCLCELNLQNYRTKRNRNGSVRFYCPQHAKVGSTFTSSIRKRPLPQRELPIIEDPDTDTQTGDNSSRWSSEVIPELPPEVKPRVKPRISPRPVLPDKPKIATKPKLPDKPKIAPKPRLPDRQPRIPDRPDFLARKVTSASMRRVDFYNARDDTKQEEPEEKIFEHNFGASVRGGRGAFGGPTLGQDVEEEKSSSESSSSDDEIGELLEANLGADVNKNMTIKDAKEFWKTLKRQAIQHSIINYLETANNESGKDDKGEDNVDIIDRQEEGLDKTINIQQSTNDEESKDDTSFERRTSEISNKNEDLLEKAIKELNRESQEFTSDRWSKFSATCHRPSNKHFDKGFKERQQHGSPRKRPEFKRSDSDQSDVRHAQRVQLAARKLARQKEQNRIFLAQQITRQLEEAELKLQEVEKQGVEIEKALKENPDTREDEKPMLRRMLCSLYSNRQALLQYEAELLTAKDELITNQHDKQTNSVDVSQFKSYDGGNARTFADDDEEESDDTNNEVTSTRNAQDSSEVTRIQVSMPGGKNATDTASGRPATPIASGVRDNDSSSDSSSDKYVIPSDDDWTIVSKPEMPSDIPGNLERHSTSIIADSINQLNIRDAPGRDRSTPSPSQETYDSSANQPIAVTNDSKSDETINFVPAALEPESWECPHCTLHNKDDVIFCAACNGWRCGMCTYVNLYRRKKCEMCCTNRPAYDHQQRQSRESYA